MIYYAHTADAPDGHPDPDQTRQQKLSDHLQRVAAEGRGSIIELAQRINLLPE